MKKILLIDGFSILFRSFYATAKKDLNQTSVNLRYTSSLYNNNQEPTNAIFTFISTFLNVKDKINPDYILVAFDCSDKSWRHDYNFYKANRKDAPIHLKQQINPIKKFLELYGIKWVEVSHLEADDIIGVMAKKASVLNYKTIILSGDYDLLQLVSSKTNMLVPQIGYQPMKKYDVNEVIKKHEGLNPSQIPDLKGLMGDSSDNIPGVKGIGPITAYKLLNEFKTIENILNNLDKVNGPIKTKLETYKKDAILSKKLATIMVNERINVQIKDCKLRPMSNDLVKFLDYYNLNKIKNKIGV